MRTTRIVEITIDREILILRTPGAHPMRWCKECGRKAVMLTREEAMEITGESWAQLAHRVNSHIVDPSFREELPAICINSL